MHMFFLRTISCVTFEPEAKRLQGRVVCDSSVRILCHAGLHHTEIFRNALRISISPTQVTVLCK